MAESAKHPEIRRDLDIFPVRNDGKDMICLRDPLRVAPEAILLPPHVFFIVSHMDGKHSILDIQTAFTRQFNQLIMSDQVNELVNSLDDQSFMNSAAFKNRLINAENEFAQKPVRPSSHSGEAYPPSKKEINSFINGFFDDDGKKDSEQTNEKTGGLLSGILAPHIDLNRGGPLFARAYRAIKSSPPPHTALIFGTAHFGTHGPYILALKDFETPLGRARLDRAFADTIVRLCPFDVTAGSLVHKIEHSIEFQVLMLQHLLPNSKMPRIVPVLCSSVMELLRPGDSPTTLPEVSGFLDAVKAAIDSCEGPVLVITGADMCHVGQKFNTEKAISPEYLEQVRLEDEAALESAENLDAEGFFEKISSINNRNNICSVTSIYTQLKLLKDSSATMLGYDMAVDKATDSAVGFPAMNFFN